MMRTLLEVMVFCTVFNSVWGQTLKCYKCNSYTNSSCQSTSSNTNVAYNCTQCVKVYQQLVGVEDQSDIYHRDCRKEEAEKNQCEKLEIHASLKSDMCLCNTDLCNSAPSARPVRYVMLLALLLAVELSVSTVLLP